MDISMALMIGVILFALLLGPFLFWEIKSGKLVRRRGTPMGQGDVQPGNRANPAPGHVEAHVDPWMDQQSQPHVHRH
jgi:hypothetical protein